jgi:hypothetical protein
MPEFRKMVISNKSLIHPATDSINRLPVYRMCLSHQVMRVKNFIQLFAGITLLMANVSFAELLFPSNLLTKRGSSSAQPLEVLARQDQQGSDDNLDSYIVFDTDERGYAGTLRFNLPAAPDKTVQQLIFRANYRGPEISTEKWEFELLNVKTGKWIHIADNRNAAEGTWSSITATIIEPAQFINTRNQLFLRYVTRNPGNNSHLDFVALEAKGSDAGDFMDTPGLDTAGLASDAVRAAKVGSSAGWWQPAPGLRWQIQYTGTLNTSLNVDVYNLDLFDTSAATISTLRAKGKRVICYFSGGSYESWRPDSHKFPASVLGRSLDGWVGERWLDIRKLDILIPIMRARIYLAAQKRCDGVDPDNVDGYSNNTGFALTYKDQWVYNIALAKMAHAAGLGIGLKNNIDQVKDLVNYFDFAVNEECFQYGECDTLRPFVDSGKAVFGIEYNLSNASFCPQANAMNFDFLKKNLSMDAWRQACR